MLFLFLFLNYSKFRSVQSTPSGTSEDKVTMRCTETNMTATFNESALEGVIMNITAHPTCNNVSYHLDANGTKMVTIPFTGCPNLTQGVKQMRQTTEVAVEMSKPINDVVHRVFTYHFSLHCDFDRHLKVSQSQSMRVSQQIKTFLLSSKTNFSASIRYYKTSAFAQIAEAPLRVAANEPIYLKIEAAYANPLIKFVIQECFATPTSNQYDPVRYLFFSDRCPIDPTFRSYGVTDSQNKFSIDAFAFVKVKKTVFFHCKLLVCKSDTTTPECTQECHLQRGRRRRGRRAVEEDSSLNEVTVNSGAVVYQEKPTCDDITCPRNSVCVDLTPAECKCLDGYVLDSLNHRCANQNLVQLQGLHLDQRFSDLYFDSDPRQSLHLARYFERNMMVRLSNYSKIVGLKVGGVGEERVLTVTLLCSNSSTPREAYTHFLQCIFTSKEAVPGINTGVLPTLQDDFVDDAVVYPGLFVGALLVVLIIVITIVIVRNHSNGKMDKPSSKTYSFKDDYSEDSSQ